MYPFTVLKDAPPPQTYPWFIAFYTDGPTKGSFYICHQTEQKLGFFKETNNVILELNKTPFIDWLTFKDPNTWTKDPTRKYLVPAGTTGAQMNSAQILASGMLQFVASGNMLVKLGNLYFFRGIPVGNTYGKAIKELVKEKQAVGTNWNYGSLTDYANNGFSTVFNKVYKFLSIEKNFTFQFLPSDSLNKNNTYQHLKGWFTYPPSTNPFGEIDSLFAPPPLNAQDLASQTYTINVNYTDSPNPPPLKYVSKKNSSYRFVINNGKVER